MNFALIRQRSAFDLDTWQPFKKQVCSSLSVNVLQLQQTAIYSQSLSFYIQNNESGAWSHNFKDCGAVKIFIVYSFWHRLRGRRERWRKLQSIKKSRSHHTHESFRTHRCFYNLISKKLSAKGDQVVLKTFHVQGGFDNSAENPPHPATVTFAGFPNAFPAERLKTAHLNSLLQQLSIFELLFPL